MGNFTLVKLIDAVTIKGATGSTGPTGSQGTAGANGSNGSTGPTGAYQSPRVASTTSSATPTPNADTSDGFELTAQAVTGAFAVPTGTPTDQQKLMIQIVDAGTAEPLTWSTATGGYTAGGPALPSTTTTGKILTLGFQYSTMNSLNKWLLIGTATQP